MDERNRTPLVEAMRDALAALEPQERAEIVRQAEADEWGAEVAVNGIAARALAAREKVR